MRKLSFLFSAVLLLGLAACSDDPVHVTGVELNRSTLPLVAGTYEVLEATVVPNNAEDRHVTWSSNNDAVATVTGEGRVNAIAEGTAVITVTTRDGNHRATATVTVTPAPIPVTGVELDRNSVFGIIGDEITLVATLIPEDATNQNITWESTDESVATVDDNGNVTIVGEGEANIRVITEEGDHVAFAELRSVDGVRVTQEITVADETVEVVAIWARTNVSTFGTFVENPQDAGSFFQWNDRTEWPATGTGVEIGFIGTQAGNSGSPNDYWQVANDPCPPGWRIPTANEARALAAAVTAGAATREWVVGWNETGVNGSLISVGDDEIFFPALGNRAQTNGNIATASNRYWTSETDEFPAGIMPVSIQHTAASFNTPAFQRAAAAQIRCVVAD